MQGIDKKRVAEIFQALQDGEFATPLRIELVKIWNEAKVGEHCCLSCTNQVDSVIEKLKQLINES